jgi:hypothetical protein
VTEAHIDCFLSLPYLTGEWYAGEPAAVAQRVDRRPGGDRANPGYTALPKGYASRT